MTEKSVKILTSIILPIFFVGLGLLLYWLFFMPVVTMIVLPDETELTVELATDPISQAQGLSNRTELGELEGVLFGYDGSLTRTFWMKDMNFEIDMIWLDDETIVGIDHSVPVLEDGEFTRRTSPSPVNRVLEVNAGFSAAHGLVVGDEVDIIYGK